MSRKYSSSCLHPINPSVGVKLPYKRSAVRRVVIYTEDYDILGFVPMLEWAKKMKIKIRLHNIITYDGSVGYVWKMHKKDVTMFTLRWAFE